MFLNPMRNESLGPGLIPNTHNLTLEIPGVEAVSYKSMKTPLGQKRVTEVNMWIFPRESGFIGMGQEAG